MDGPRFDQLARILGQGISRRQTIRGVGAGLAGVVAGGTLLGRGAQAAPGGKVTICHFTHSQTNPFEIITVSVASFQGQHQQHGDFAYGDCCVDSQCAIPAGVQCAAAFCNRGTCDLRPTPGAPCDDGIACTVADTCGAAVDQCAGTPNDALCDDGIDCTDDVCNVFAGGCVSTPNHALCDDGNPCTDDTCSVDAGGCVSSDNGTCAEDACGDRLHNGRPCHTSSECCSGCCVSRGASFVCANGGRSDVCA
jgi:hypothetical protein